MEPSAGACDAPAVVDAESFKRPLGRRHSSAALASPPDEKGPKTATSYSFRERSPSSKSAASEKKANQKPLVVRFDEKVLDERNEVKELFLSVPMTVRRASTVQWKEDFEMTVINSSETSPGWRRSATSLKSPQRSAPVHQVCSPSHQRSQSMRVGFRSAKEDERRRPTAGSLLQVPSPHRPRGTSLPSHRALVEPSSAAFCGAHDQQQRQRDEEGDYYLIRQFIVHGKGNKVVNRGDSFRRLARNPSPNASLSNSQLHLSLSGENGSSGSTDGGASRRGSQWTVGPEPASPAPVDCPSSASSSSSLEPLRVVMLGGPGVGKTALTAQFMTSEYLNTYEASLDDDACDRCVSVLLDGEESQLVFIDHPHGEISLENCMSTYSPHAYVIVYSVVDVESVRTAEETLHFLWRHASSASCPNATPPVVILVANKIDLVRSRVVTPQAGKSLATSFDCKYIETSSGMQHNVDELLVGILKQIRLKMLWHQQQQQDQMAASSSSSRSLFRKRSGRRRQQQASPLDNSGQSGEVASIASQEGTGLVGSVVDCCGIVSGPTSPNALWTSSKSAPGGQQPQHRRSASLRVRKMLGKAVWTCADYYGGKSRSCEDLHVL